MTDQEKQATFQDENRESYLVHYVGNFEEDLSKVDYAVGYKITDSLGTVAIKEEDLDRLLNDIPSIDAMEFRGPYVLQEIVPSEVDGISDVLINPNLDLTGKGVLVGILDTGIDYLNQEFINEDGTTRILRLWDQEIMVETGTNLYIGREFSNDDINRAIKNKSLGKDPYEIVPSKDEIGHGTMIASVIGSKGYNKEVKGIAKDVQYVVVKLSPSPSYEKILRKNNQKIIPVYNDSEVVSAIEYLKNVSLEMKMPMVICIAVGGTLGSHSGDGIVGKYITSIGRIRGVVVVCGVGNEGNSDGHAHGNLKYKGEIKTIELNIPNKIYDFTTSIWVQSPDRTSLNIISPAGESTGFIKPNVVFKDEVNYILDGSRVKITILDPEIYTGSQVILLQFRIINKGIWRIELRGESVVKGRYDMWINPKEFIPNGVTILNSNQLSTILVPSTASRLVTATYYNSKTKGIVSESGKGFNTNGLINPDISAPGIDINAVQAGGGVRSFSGASAGVSVVAGACTLLLQWGVVNKNDPLLYTSKVRSYLIYGTEKREKEVYPNEIVGYGFLSLINTFYVIAGIYNNTPLTRGVYEGYVRGLFQRMDVGIFNNVRSRWDGK